MTKNELLEDMEHATNWPVDTRNCIPILPSRVRQWMDAVRHLPTRATYDQSERIAACERDIALIVETLSEAARKVCPDL